MRHDEWHFQEPLELDEFQMEILQPAVHPHRPRFGDVHELSVSWTSDISDIKLTSPQDVSNDPEYRNYHGHASRKWMITSGPVQLSSGIYTTALTVEWQR